MRTQLRAAAIAMVAASLFAVGSAQAAFIAGWDFTQYAGAGSVAISEDPDHVRADHPRHAEGELLGLRRELRRGGASQPFGTMWMNGTNGSTNVDADNSDLPADDGLARSEPLDARGQRDAGRRRRVRRLGGRSPGRGRELPGRHRTGLPERAVDAGPRRRERRLRGQPERPRPAISSGELVAHLRGRLEHAHLGRDGRVLDGRHQLLRARDGEPHDLGGGLHELRAAATQGTTPSSASASRPRARIRSRGSTT